METGNVLNEVSVGTRFLRFRDVQGKTGLSRSTVYGRIRSGSFPAPVSLGGRAVGFVAEEVEGYLASLIERRDRKNERLQMAFAESSPENYHIGAPTPLHSRDPGAREGNKR